MEKDGILLAIPRSLQRSSAKVFPTAKAERFHQPSQFHLWQVNSSSGSHHRGIGFRIRNSSTSSLNQVKKVDMANKRGTTVGRLLSSHGNHPSE